MLKDLSILIRKGIDQIIEYIPGKPIEDVQAELGLKEIIKLASNENPLGPSPLVTHAMMKEMELAHCYPEGPSTLLRKKIAKNNGINENMVIFGNGADNILTIIAQAFINEGDLGVTAFPTFSVYDSVVRIMGGSTVSVPLKNYTHDLKSMLQAVSSNTKLIFLCNPNNPTGTMVTKTEIEDFLQAVPSHCVVVLDEAYIDYADPDQRIDHKSFINRGYNLLVVRTFSKAYALAGMRIGYAMGPAELIKILRKVAEPFPVNRAAQAGALAALKDSAYLEQVLAVNREGREYLYREFEALGLSFVPSQANFVLVDLGMNSKEAFERLLRKGIIIRPGGIWNLPNHARVTIGTMEQNRKFIEALKKVLE